MCLSDETLEGLRMTGNAEYKLVTVCIMFMYVQ